MADTAYASRTLTAMFDTEAEAQRAVARLRDAGISDSSIRMTQGSGSTTTTTTTTSSGGYSDQHKGFFESLGDFFFPDEDRYAYAEGLARGGYLVTVSSYDESYQDTIIDILDDEGSVDLDARESEWRSSGWTDYRGSDYYNEDEYNRTHPSAAAAGMGAGAMAAAGAGGLAGGMAARGTVYDDGMAGRDATIGSDRQMASDMSGGVGGATQVTGGGAYGDASMTGAAATRADDLRDQSLTGSGRTGGELNEDGTVKVVEEQLRVGKREAEGGRVRVRSYVREQPVEANVELRSTRVFVERRPVDRAVNAGDVSFQDRTIEAREHVEEAVVAKEARVVEEIGLRQESESHVETISDTVRKTEVEIEDERTGEVTRISGDDATRLDRDRT